jgi:hypothetical protein
VEGSHLGFHLVDKMRLVAAQDPRNPEVRAQRDKP